MSRGRPPRAVAHRRRRAGRAPSTAGGRDERGSVLVLVALSLTVLVICTALTVDLGRVSARRADLQNVADAIALDVVRLIDGRTAAATTADPRWAATVEASRQRNDFAPEGERQLTVALGLYDGTTGEFTEVTGASVPRAVQVEVADRIEYAFAPGGITSTRRAVAAQTAQGGVQVASFAAGLDSSRGALLDDLLGEALDVTLVGSEGLAGGAVGLDALATELGLSLASPDEALAVPLTVADLLRAEAEVLRQDGDAARALLLDQVVASLPASSTPVALGDLLVIGAGGSGAAARAGVDALELLTAVALVGNGDAALTVPAAGLAAVGGTVTGTSQVTVVESPRWAFGPPGTTATTAQVRIASELQVTVPGASRTDLSLEVEVAPTSATITDVSCGAPQVLGLDVATGLASARAEVGTILAAAGVDVAEVRAHAEVGAAPGVERVEVVVPPDVLGEGRDVTVPGVGMVPADVMIDGIDLLDGAAGPVDGLVGALVDTVVGPLLVQHDAQVVQPLLSLVGLAAPGAQVTPLAMRCSGPDLVG